jgi:CHAT domain-containing protein
MDILKGGAMIEKVPLKVGGNIHQTLAASPSTGRGILWDIHIKDYSHPYYWAPFIIVG